MAKGYLAFSSFCMFTHPLVLGYLLEVCSVRMLALGHMGQTRNQRSCTPCSMAGIAVKAAQARFSRFCKVASSLFGCSVIGLRSLGTPASAPICRKNGQAWSCE